jgi:hypothetical protein
MHRFLLTRYVWNLPNQAQVFLARSYIISDVTIRQRPKVSTDLKVTGLGHDSLRIIRSTAPQIVTDRGRRYVTKYFVSFLTKVLTGLGHESLNIFLRDARNLLSVLDPASALPRA